MKYFISYVIVLSLSLLLSVCYADNSVDIGMSEEEVIARMGEPLGRAVSDNTTILQYSAFRIILKEDKVVDSLEDKVKKIFPIVLEQKTTKIQPRLPVVNQSMPTSKSLKKKVEILINEKKFKSLDDLAKTLFQEKARFESGSWQLAYFYRLWMIESFSINYKKKSAFLKFIEKWESESPKSIVPKIILAKAYIKYAWEARGVDWAYKVTDKGWKGFNQNLTIAWDILNKAESLGVDDPEFYDAKLTVMNGLCMPEQEIEAVFHDAIALEPLYYRNYYVRAHFLLPRWGGKPGELADLADWAVQKTKATEGESLYARIVSELCGVEGIPALGNDFFERYGFSWEKVKRGFADIEKLYPNSDLNKNEFCWLACMANDRAKAKELFGLLGDGWNDIKKKIWKDVICFNKFKRWADGSIDYPNDKRLHLAVENGDLDSLLKLLEEGVNANVRDIVGNTPLHAAVRSDVYNSDEAVELLLKKGADSNAIGFNGWTPLCQAIEMGKASIVRILLKNKDIDVNKKIGKDWAPIYFATYNKQIDIVLELLKRNDIDVNTQTDKGWTPLYLAVFYDLPDLVDAFLERKDINVNLQTNKGWTILCYATYYEKTDLILKLLKRKDIDVNLETSDGYTALMTAKNNNNDEIVEMLKRFGAK